MTPHEADAAATDSAPASWREQAVARSLDSARLRAENRVQRFIDAAFELLSASGPGEDFTVQEVVEKSGQSLRSFYQYFGGKQELMLALFEESVRLTAEELRNDIEGEKDPLERLHRLVVEYYKLCRPKVSTRGKKNEPLALAEFAQQLMTASSLEATRAFAPLVALFSEVLDDVATAGAVRSDLHRDRIVGILLEMIMFNSFSSTIGGSMDGSADSEPAEELWDLILHGIG
jgi:AcrR family transcriptional regulator